MSASFTLYGRARNGRRLAEALEICLPVLEGQDAESIALLYSPGECVLARLKGKKLLDCRDEPIELDNFFEARVFNEQTEMRWRNDEGGRGRTVLLSASPIPELCQKELDEDVSLTYWEKLPQTYLLWGEGVEDQAKTGLADGWSRLTTARIGALNVPVKVRNAVKVEDESKKPRVLLHVYEYLAEYDNHGNVAVAECESDGNVAVAEERLLKLEAV
ncbi:MAG TPA: CRISPR-associated protein Csx19 [Blastocatellia bacterium]|nr:CRISPR-associated protein Csx19 [Blastocatellia bacterium]HMZ18769.1 CRISPR-associated protein Csx19 [Blastocatellia bacterium]